MVTEEYDDEQDQITARLRSLSASVERDYGDRFVVSRSDAETQIAPAHGEGLPVGW